MARTGFRERLKAKCLRGCPLFPSETTDELYDSWFSVSFFRTCRCSDRSENNIMVYIISGVCNISGIGFNSKKLSAGKLSFLSIQCLYGYCKLRQL